MHRFDAQSAGGDTDAAAAYHPAFAADGIDELVMGFAARRISPDADAPADCVLSGPASGAYLFLWNRCTAEEAGVAITGDPAILRAWNAGVRVRWS